MKRCMPCTVVSDDSAPTCANCGEASWLPIAPAPIKAVPIDPAPVFVIPPPPAVVAAPTQADPAPAADVVPIPEPVAEPAPAPPAVAPSPILANPQPPAQPHRGTRWQRGNR
jgi:hypothetical protein